MESRLHSWISCSSRGCGSPSSCTPPAWWLWDGCRHSGGTQGLARTAPSSGGCWAAVLVPISPVGDTPSWAGTAARIMEQPHGAPHHSSCPAGAPHRGTSPPFLLTPGNILTQGPGRPQARWLHTVGAAGSALLLWCSPHEHSGCSVWGSLPLPWVPRQAAATDAFLSPHYFFPCSLFWSLSCSPQWRDKNAALHCYAKDLS